MDEPKDIQKDDPISRFFEYEVRTSPFGENKSGERAYRRVERVVAALHLLTNHLTTAEPLRSAIRTESLAFLECALSIRDEMRSTDSVQMTAFRAIVKHLSSLVRMLAVSGYASAQNVRMIIEALDEIGTFIAAAQRSPLSDRVSFSREAFLDVSNVHDIVRKSVRDIKDKRAIKDTMSLTDTDTSFTTQVKKSDTPIGDRKNQILNILMNGAELGIRDIAAHLPEYGEKTIQRELSQLVLMGKVKKTGFKRWSKYSRAG